MDTSKKIINITENDFAIGDTIDTINIVATVENNSKTNAKNLWKKVDVERYEV